MSQDIAPLFSKIGLPKPKVKRGSKNINDGRDTPLKRAQKAINRVKAAPMATKPASRK